MVRCTSLHQNVKTGETFWWLLRIDECAVDDKSALGLRTHSLAWTSCFWAFSKVMSLCHLYPLHLFTWLVVHTLLGITGKVACSFGLNWPTSLGCNGCQTCWCFVHPILLSLYLARWLSGHAWHPVWWYKHAGWGLGLLYKEMFGVGASVVGPDTGWRWPNHQGTVRVNNISDQWKRMCWFSTWGVTKVQKMTRLFFNTSAIVILSSKLSLNINIFVSQNQLIFKKRSQTQFLLMHLMRFLSHSELILGFLNDLR